MPYRKVSYAEQMWYILKFKWKEVTRMPRKPKHPCHYPGCPKLTDNRFCEEHTKLYNETTRSTTGTLLYTVDTAERGSGFVIPM